MFAAYTLYSPSHWSFGRYACLPVLLLMAAGIAGVARALQSPRIRRERFARLMAATLGSALVAFQVHQLAAFLEVHLHAGQAGGFLRAWEALGPKIPRESTVGAVQAGVYGWFSGRPIVNLDGKVDSDAYRAIVDGRLHAYVASRGIDYILDWEAIVHALLTRHAPPGAGFSLREVARQRGPTPVVPYRVERDRSSLGAPAEHRRGPPISREAAGPARLQDVQRHRRHDRKAGLVPRELQGQGPTAPAAPTDGLAARSRGIRSRPGIRTLSRSVAARAAPEQNDWHPESQGGCFRRRPAGPTTGVKTKPRPPPPILAPRAR